MKNPSITSKIQEWVLPPDTPLPIGGKIKLTFEAFDLEPKYRSRCIWDWVEVSYGSFSEKYCSTSIPGPFVSESPITVKIRTDYSRTYSGFRATWTTETTTTTGITSGS